MYIEAYTLADAYTQIRELLLDAPIVETRGFRTKEISPLMVSIENPRARLAYHPNRHYNLAFNIAEVVTYITGINSVEALEFFNPRIKDYSDNGLWFYGAYGPRIQPYIDDVVSKLRSDDGSRQAVISIYNSKDMQVKTKDVPCTLAIQFMVRDKKLNGYVFMRSNDLFWGFQYDMFSFTVLHELISNLLNIPMGHYDHVANSMHVYDYHFEMLQEIETMKSIEMPELGLGLSDYAELGHLLFDIKDVAGVREPKNDFEKVLLKFAVNKLGLNRQIEVPGWAKGFI